MTDAQIHAHDEAAALRIRIRTLGPGAIAEIARGAHAPQAQVRMFRNGLTILDPQTIAAVAAAVCAIETARADGGDNVVQFPAAKTRTKNGKAKTAPRAPDDGKAHEAAATAREGDADKTSGAEGANRGPEAAGEAPGAPGAEETSDQTDEERASRWRGSRGRWRRAARRRGDRRASLDGERARKRRR